MSVYQILFKHSI